LELLEEFWANSNQLESFQEIERELGRLEGLHTVYFEHNPLQKTAGATYRNKIRLCLKAIKQIDATYVVFKGGRANSGMLLPIREVD
jgi:protein phosphatase 1 regulatory subunit 7